MLIRPHDCEAATGQRAGCIVCSQVRSLPGDRAGRFEYQRVGDGLGLSEQGDEFIFSLVQNCEGKHKAGLFFPRPGARRPSRPAVLPASRLEWEMRRCRSARAHERRPGSSVPPVGPPGWRDALHPMTAFAPDSRELRGGDSTIRQRLSELDDVGSSRRLAHEPCTVRAGNCPSGDRCRSNGGRHRLHRYG